MINTVVLVGIISNDIVFDKQENKNNEIKFVTFTLSLNEKFLFPKKIDDKQNVLIKTYDFFLKNWKFKDYKNTFLALKGRILINRDKIYVFADKIKFLGKKS